MLQVVRTHRQHEVGRIHELACELARPVVAQVEMSLEGHQPRPVRRRRAVPRARPRALGHEVDQAPLDRLTAGDGLGEG